MRLSLFDLLPEFLEIVLSGLAVLVLSVAGVYIEHFALVTVRSGDTTIGLWAVVPGAVCLGFGYLLATDRVAPKLTEVRRRLAERE